MFDFRGSTVLFTQFAEKLKYEAGWNTNKEVQRLFWSMGVGIFLVPDGSLSCTSRYFFTSFIILCIFLSKKEQM